MTWRYVLLDAERTRLVVIPSLPKALLCADMPTKPQTPNANNHVSGERQRRGRFARLDAIHFVHKLHVVRTVHRPQLAVGYTKC